MSDYEIIKYILNDINEDLDDEEKVHLLLNKTVSENNECKESFGQRVNSVTPLPALQCRSTICCLNSGMYDF